MPALARVRTRGVPAARGGRPRCTARGGRDPPGEGTTVTPYRAFDEALDLVNASAYGLQAGIFTRDVAKLMRAWDRLEVGGVMGNEVPTWRMDRMPYGGAKASGLGREGVRYAIEDMTELRLLTLHSE